TRRFARDRRQEGSSNSYRASRNRALAQAEDDSHTSNLRFSAVEQPRKHSGLVGTSILPSGRIVLDFAFRRISDGSWLAVFPNRKVPFVRILFDVGRRTLDVALRLCDESGEFSWKTFRARKFLLADTLCHSSSDRVRLRGRISHSCATARSVDR